MRRATLVSNTKTALQGTVTAANISVVLTAGSASVDISSVTIPRNYQGHEINITDTNGKTIKGFVGGDGAGTVQKIFSAKGGTVQNWSAQMAGFDDTTDCTYTILKVYDLKEVSGFGGAGLTASQQHVSTVAANAFFFSDGLDFTAYLDGRHYLRLKDGAGVVAWGKIKGQVSGGETLSNELITSWTNRAGFSFDTLIVNANGHDIDSAIVTSKNAYTYTNDTLSTGQLSKIVLDVTVNSGVIPKLLTRKADLSVNATILSPISDRSVYYTSSAVDKGLQVGYGGVETTNFSLLVSQKQVLTPPATGCIITNSLGAESLEVIPTTFNPNNITDVRVFYAGSPRDTQYLAMENNSDVLLTEDGNLLTTEIAEG